ncbi:hypothetical protein SDC9_20935 [bioreactor metagenome]|uniref:EamA domain-containing protein n=1 Tax=bioreactor metagenome TaxID=1076179 RepID=A0A644U838_9ZZZZ|nr:DMT family transporter [Negativicutes bacterium]
MSRRQAVISLAVAAILWSSGGVLIKWTDWHPMAIAGGRSLIAAIIIWFAFRKEQLTFSKTQWAGAMAYCSMVCTFVIATKWTTAANAILLQYTAPVYVALLSGWLLGEKTTRRDWLTICMVFGGMLFFFLDKVTLGGMIGNLFGIGSGISFGLFTIFMRRQKDASPFGSVLLGNVLAFLVSVPFFTTSSFTAANLVAVGFLGIFQLGLAYVLYTRGICHVRALEATLITTIEPILNPVWVFLFIGETPGMYALIGGLIVVAALTMRYKAEGCSENHMVHEVKKGKEGQFN